MKIIIQFTSNVSYQKFLHNLKNVKKSCPILRHYIAEIAESGFRLVDSKGGGVAEFDYCFLEESQAVSFDNFRGKFKEEIKKMLMFRLPESIGEKAYVSDREEKINLYFDLDDFFLIEKGVIYKMGTDYEKIIRVNLYHIPRELKIRQK